MCLETLKDQPPDLQGGYSILKCWYRYTLEQQPNPSRADLAKVSRDYYTLYQRDYPSPPGRPLPIHISPFQIEDGLPS